MNLRLKAEVQEAKPVESEGQRQNQDRRTTVARITVVTVTDVAIAITAIVIPVKGAAKTAVYRDNREPRKPRPRR